MFQIGYPDFRENIYKQYGIGFRYLKEGRERLDFPDTENTRCCITSGFDAGCMITRDNELVGVFSNKKKLGKPLVKTALYMGATHWSVYAGAPEEDGLLCWWYMNFPVQVTKIDDYDHALDPSPDRRAVWCKRVVHIRVAI